jgi:hypothetical protein
MGRPAAIPGKIASSGVSGTIVLQPGWWIRKPISFHSIVFIVVFLSPSFVTFVVPFQDGIIVSPRQRTPFAGHQTTCGEHLSASGGLNIDCYIFPVISFCLNSVAEKLCAAPYQGPTALSVFVLGMPGLVAGC